MKLKLKWKYAEGEFDMETMQLLCIKARGKRMCGPDEIDAELCIKDGMNFTIADIHLGDVDSSNILCEEIARRWNEFQDWHDAENDEEPPKDAHCLLRVEFCNEGEEMQVDYLTTVWGGYGWTEDYLDQIADHYATHKITHWKQISKPKGVEK